jgi:signal peptidase
MHIVKKCIKIGIDLLTAVVFCFLIMIIVSKVSMLFSGKQYFEIFGYSVFTVATGSMEPTISQNDIVIVKKTNDIKVNDIVTYEKDGNYITHRVISMSDDTLVTKGDANNTNDISIPRTSLVGKVINIFEKGGVWQKIFTTPSVIIMMFVTLLLFDFAFSFKGFKKKGELPPKEEGVTVNEITDNPKQSITKEEVQQIKKDLPPVSDKTLGYTIGLNLSDIQAEINRDLEEEIEDGEER